jgi:cupin 2 domain-containing protein
MTAANIFLNIPQPTADEFFETLVQRPDVKIERIISHGHSSPKDFWYDQDMNEWILLLKGRARLMFEGEAKQVEPSPRNYLNIPAHKRLAVYY